MNKAFDIEIVVEPYLPPRTCKPMPGWEGKAVIVSPDVLGKIKDILWEAQKLTPKK